MWTTIKSTTSDRYIKQKLTTSILCTERYIQFFSAFLARHLHVTFQMKFVFKPRIAIRTVYSLVKKMDWLYMPYSSSSLREHFPTNFAHTPFILSTFNIDNTFIYFCGCGRFKLHRQYIFLCFYFGYRRHRQIYHCIGSGS